MNRLKCLACVVLTLVAAPGARADDRPPDKILKEIKAVEVPEFNPKLREDPKALEAFRVKFEKAVEKKADLIGDLYRIDPENAELPSLMGERWQVVWMRTDGETHVENEINQILAHSRNEKLKIEGAFWKARLPLMAGTGEFAANLKRVEDFTRRAPKDDRGALLLSLVAEQASEPKAKTALYKKIVETYPADNKSVAMVRGILKKQDAVGKPFELEFTDAIKGTAISSKNLRGKVVVIDFWATWCAPCVAEMPHFKTLYARYRDKGVEIIGVNLDEPEDQGGLEKMKEFVAKNQITWPQFYQGKGTESPFAVSWGVDSLPSVFLVDQEGKVVSTDAGETLDALIPALLEKNKPKSAAK